MVEAIIIQYSEAIIIQYSDANKEEKSQNIPFN